MFFAALRTLLFMSTEASAQQMGRDGSVWTPLAPACSSSGVFGVRMSSAADSPWLWVLSEGGHWFLFVCLLPSLVISVGVMVPHPILSSISLTRSLSVKSSLSGTPRMTMLFLRLAFSAGSNLTLSIFWFSREMSVARYLTWSLRTWTVVFKESTVDLSAFVSIFSSMSSSLFSYLERNSWHLSSINASFWTAWMASDSQGVQYQWNWGRLVRNLYSSLSKLAQLWQIHFVQRSHLMAWDASVRFIWHNLQAAASFSSESDDWWDAPWLADCDP